jgi:hypothetical protein
MDYADSWNESVCPEPKEIFLDMNARSGIHELIVPDSGKISHLNI